MNTQKLFTASVLAFALLACGEKSKFQVVDSSLTQIVGGNEAKSDDEVAKSTVALLISLEGYPEVSLCSGTLVASNVIVTAAHCFENYEDYGYNEKTGKMEHIVLKVTGGSVVFGTNTKAEGVQKREITKFVVHPQYGAREAGEGDWNDIAVIKFDGEKPAGYEIAPMLEDKAELTKGLAVTFAGYGITSPLGNNSDVDDSGLLRKGETVLTSAEYEGNELLFDLPKSGVSTCQGDSGGPAYAKISGKLTLVGVTSRGADAECRGISISTNVAAHVDFLKKTVGSMKLVNAVAHYPTQAK